CGTAATCVPRSRRLQYGPLAGFLSMRRVTSLLLPMCMFLAFILADRQPKTLVCGFAVLQGLVAVIFSTRHRFLS
ncbi:MAG: hypothetical protein OSB03_09770, partial [Vicinamibacterales bacterium]|nr:hypothetical protein [Vicinamibacterales bacterium]